MSRVLVVPDDVGVPGALDATEAVQYLWLEHQAGIHDGYGVDDEAEPLLEAFRAAAGFWTQDEYEADRQRRFREHTEWLKRMQRTNWGRDSDG